MWKRMLYDAIKSIYLYQAKCICKQLSSPRVKKKSRLSHFRSLTNRKYPNTLKNINAL